MAADNDAGRIATECVGARVRMLNREITRLYDEGLRPLGLKFSQLNLLAIIALRGPVQPVEITRVLSLEKSTLSRNVRIMEDNGWIASADGGAGNSRLLRITSTGRRLLEKAAPAWERAQAKATALLGASTAAALRRAADRLAKTKKP